MKYYVKLIAYSIILSVSQLTFADITGTWHYIDDKTGEAKGIVKIEQKANGTYAGIAQKITPRAGYTPKEFCSNCPAPYTNKPIIGLEVLSGLRTENNIDYSNGKIIDPVSGKIYRLKARVSANGKKLFLRGYIGISAIGRSQTWVRIE